MFKADQSECLVDARARISIARLNGRSTYSTTPDRALDWKKNCRKWRPNTFLSTFIKPGTSKLSETLLRKPTRSVYSDKTREVLATLD